MKDNIIKVFGVIAAIGVLGVIAIASVVIYFSMGLPKISSLADYKPNIPSRILSRDGTVLAEISKEKRIVTSMENIPERIVNAFLSAEDSSFYEHSGVDYIGVLRALIANLKAGRVVQGGSTITQQVAKSLLLTSERSISRKIKDFLLAQRIEDKFSKNEILFLYLNQVYLGGGYYGVTSAFEGYYGKTLNEATIAESAMVAGLLVAPGRYSPYINPKRAKVRQAYVLKRMLTNNKISQNEYDSAVDEKIKFRLRKFGSFKAGYFTDWVRQRVIEVVGEEKFLTDGYTVETTLDWELQQIAEREVTEGVKQIDKRQGFKGPIGKLEEEKWEENFKKNRIEFYKEKSLYFTINEVFERSYELVYDEEIFHKIKDHESTFENIIKRKRYLSGYLPEDPFLEKIEVGQVYKAIVEKTDNLARIIYCNINGVRTIIPYSGFKWAHVRNITEERNYFGWVQRPSTIVERGDIILVTIKEKSSSFTKQMNKEFNKVYKRLTKEQKERLGAERYVIADLEQEADAQGALVSINPFSGEIISFVGGADFSKSQFNRAIQSRRQPGSAFKPFIFAAGLENGYSPTSIIIDSPETLGGVDAALNWKPRNYDGKFKGPVTFRNSLEQSRNVPTIKLADSMGVQTILDFTSRIGFKADLDKDLSLALGSFGVTLMDIVSNYSIFPNGGKKISPISIVSVTDRFGNAITLEKFVPEDEVKEEDPLLVDKNSIDSPKEEEKQATDDLSEEIEKRNENPFQVTLSENQVYDSRLAYLMTNLLRGVVLHGTGRGTKSVSTYLGGKTGTTNNYVDAWFLGFSSNLVTGVWTGFDENQTLGWGETGAKSALPIWREYMRAGIRKFGESDFKPPSGIVNVMIDKELGKPTTGGESGFMEAFVEGTEPGAEEKLNIGDKKLENRSNTAVLEEDDYYNNQ